MSALTLKAAADLFGVSVRTVRREIADGRLVAYRVRRALRIDATEVAISTTSAKRPSRLSAAVVLSMLLSLKENPEYT